MVLMALLDLGADRDFVFRETAKLGLHERADEIIKSKETKSPAHHKKRSFKDIEDILKNSGLEKRTKSMALKIYTFIAEAEGQVHKKSMDTIHFHELGRDRAIINIVGVSAALSYLDPHDIYCSEIHDGCGHIDCAHGRVPVPVPAVSAMMKGTGYRFVQDDIETEMVTPGGLGILIGAGASYRKKPKEKEIYKTGIGRGTRDTGRDGLKIHILK
jgi:uncharacterized protein (DUF111 family)